MALFGAWALLTVLWSLSTGLGGSPDEPAHLVKAVAVADLQFNTDVVWGAGGFGASIPRTHVRVPAAYEGLNKARQCWSGKLAAPASCMPRLQDTTMVDGTTYVGTYPPTYYLAVGWPSRLMAPQRAAYAMRVMSALLAAALLAEGTINLVRREAGRVLVAAGVLAVPTTVLFLASTINPNGLEIAAAFCLWATIVGWCDGPDQYRRRSLIAAAVTAMVLTLVRPLGPAYTLLIVALALGTLAETSALRTLRSSRAGRALGVAVGVSVVLAVGYAAVNHSYSSLITWSGLSDRGSGAVAREAIDNLGVYLRQSWDLIGWQGPQELTVPGWITLIWLGLIGGFAVLALLVGTNRQRIGLAVLVLGCVVGPVVPAVVNPASPWQGRYLLPLLTGIPLLSGAIISRSPATASWRTPRIIPLGVIGFCATSYLVAHQRLMNRTVVGLPSGPLANLSEGTWNGPLAPVALFFWALVASAIWVFVMYRLVDRPSPLPDPDASP